MLNLRLLFAIIAVTCGAGTSMAQSSLPRADAPFTGKIENTLKGSVPSYAKPLRPPESAPNVVVILIDDAGFGNPSTFGGPAQTPNLDQLAAAGLRYNRFHVTGMCSPTRAALLSGRNHHRVHFGMVAEAHSGFPGYDTLWPQSAAPLATILRDNGYNTAAIGKWHLTPDDEQGPAGPLNRWPNAMGFDYFWGFLGAEDSQYDSMIVENQTVLGVPKQKDFYLTTAMADHAIDWMRSQKSQSPEQPFFMYFATGASHAPHHVPKEWADKYKGKFDDGWDALRERTFARQKELGVIPADTILTPRPDGLPAWDTQSPELQKLYARQMEVYAGYQEAADFEVGRVLTALESMGIADDTLVIYIFGDNGASLEGTVTGTFNEMTAINGFPLTGEQQLEAIKKYGGLKEWGTKRTDPHYSAAWAWAGNTPFQWGKQIASHLGGTRNGMVVAWPDGIADKGGLRSQFTHVIDIAPTILQLTNIPQPESVNGFEQIPMQGTSFAYSFADANAPEQHTQQYFEVMGNRAMYKDGWWWGCRIQRLPWKLDPEAIAKIAPDKWDPNKDPCELYDLNTDFSQGNNIAAANPEKVQELETLFWEEAEANLVLPLLGGLAQIWGFVPPGSNGPQQVTLYPDVQNISSGMIPPIYNRSYSITADIEMRTDRCFFLLCKGSDGVILANGSFLGGFALYVEGGKPRYTYSLEGVAIDNLVGKKKLKKGKTQLRYEFKADDPGKLGTGGSHRLLVNGEVVAEGRLKNTVPLRFSGYAGMDVGRDNGLPVSPGKIYYLRNPFPFEGGIDKVVFDIEGLDTGASD
jgi:arylsulfatase